VLLPEKFRNADTLYSSPARSGHSCGADYSVSFKQVHAANAPAAPGGDGQAGAFRGVRRAFVFRVFLDQRRKLVSPSAVFLFRRGCRGELLWHSGRVSSVFCAEPHSFGRGLGRRHPRSGFRCVCVPADREKGREIPGRVSKTVQFSVVAISLYVYNNDIWRLPCQL